MAKAGYAMRIFAWLTLLLSCAALLCLREAIAQDGTVCAKVRIEITQELAFERQAFDARMRISNTLDSKTLDNVSIAVHFKDEDGNEVAASSNPNDTDALFFIRVDSMDGISDVSGNGVVASASDAEIHWLIIPSPGAAAGSPQGKRYFVGATLNFNLAGEAQEIEVAPDFIVVKPQPELELDYFLTSQVRADDPLTQQIEPSEPFTLGVRVFNSGLGLARNVSINSAQPRIVENEQGLLIGFEIVGSSVNDQDVEPTLLINFGDIESMNAKIGRWLMQTNLAGQFTSFSARFTHADELGGRLTSLLKRTSAHLLIRDVLVDLPGRDNVRDFLAQDGALIKVYESELVDTIVTDWSSSSALVFDGVEGENVRFHLDLPPTAGMLYFQSLDSLLGAKKILSVTRSDGKVIKAENAWNSAEGNGANTSFYFNLFDMNGGGRYNIVFGPPAQGAQPPVMQFIADKTVGAGQRITFIVEASDPDGTIPALSVDSKPLGSTFIDYGNGTGQFDWQTGAGQGGVYPLTFRASDGTFSAARSMTITVSAVTDSDGDGLLDAWEIQYFGNLDRDGNGDFDGDGISDKDEHDQNSDPTVPDVGPAIPLVLAPVVGSEITTLTPQLRVQNSAHAGLNPSYEFELYLDENYSSLVASGNEVETADSTAWSAPQPLQDNTYYYWRARATSQGRYSEWAYGEFFVNSANEAPGPFYTSYPKNKEEVDILMPWLSVTNSSDVDRDKLTYGFQVATSTTSVNLTASVTGLLPGQAGTTSWKLPLKLTNNKRYYWRAFAKDEHGAVTYNPWVWFHVYSPNHAPSEPRPNNPVNGKEINTNKVTLEAIESSDADNNPLEYYFELDVKPTFDTPSIKRSKAILANNRKVRYAVNNLSDNTMYYWRVRALEDLPPAGSPGTPKTTGRAAGSAWVGSSFFVNIANEQPSIPTVKNPGQASWIENLAPTLQVNPARDPEQDSLSYQFELYSNSNLSGLISSATTPSAFWQVDQSLVNRTAYYWRARSVDEHGLFSQSWTPTQAFYLAADALANPPSISLTQPTGALTIGNWDELVIRWEDIDPDSNAQVSLTVGSTTILANRSEDPDGGEADSFTWKLQGFAPGQYQLSATITDGTHSMTFDSCCVLSIVNKPAPDRDLDGVPDHLDNCPDTHNPGQADSNGDGVGNACRWE